MREAMKPGDDVLVFTVSGSFRGAKGVVVELARDGARVDLRDGYAPMFFKRSEIVLANETEKPMTAGD